MEVFAIPTMQMLAQELPDRLVEFLPFLILILLSAAGSWARKRQEKHQAEEAQRRREEWAAAQGTEASGPREPQARPKRPEQPAMRRRIQVATGEQKRVEPVQPTARQSVPPEISRPPVRQTQPLAGQQPPRKPPVQRPAPTATGATSAGKIKTAAVWGRAKNTLDQARERMARSSIREKQASSPTGMAAAMRKKVRQRRKQMATAGKTTAGKTAIERQADMAYVIQSEERFAINVSLASTQDLGRAILYSEIFGTCRARRDWAPPEF